MKVGASEFGVEELSFVSILMGENSNWLVFKPEVRVSGESMKIFALTLK